MPDPEPTWDLDRLRTIATGAVGSSVLHSATIDAVSAAFTARSPSISMRAPRPENCAGGFVGSR